MTSPGNVLTSSADGLELAVRLDRPQVEPGGQVTFEVVVHNATSEPIDYRVPACSLMASVVVEVELPTSDPGRTWSGLPATFKDYVLTQGYGRGDPPPTRPERIEVQDSPCQYDRSEGLIAPGETITDRMTWTAEIVAGVPALAGDVSFRVSIGYDRQNEPPPPPSDGGPRGLWMPAYKELSVSGKLQVLGDHPGLISAAEAIDAVLVDEDFARWLAATPPTTWSNANLLLQSQPVAEGIVPAGPSWELDLFREVGVPRHWAIAFVDPFDGTLRSVTYCDIPCDR